MPTRLPAPRPTAAYGAWILLVLATTLRSAPAHAGAATLPANFADQLVAGSLDQPVGIAEIPDPASVTHRRMLVVEQRTARVKLLADGGVTTVGTVPGVSSLATERGLLGIAVDPGWPARPYLYVHCTDGRVGNRIAISRFTVTGDLSDTGTGQLQFDSASRYDLITRLPDNAINHNGGTVRFGPDQRLYVSLGDDASGCPALDNTQLVGKILRLDVSRLPAGPGGPAPTAILAPSDNPYATSPDSNAMLVYALGLRNPFRFDVDPANGALLIGDVGENTWEELDLVTTGGVNAGWPRYEGTAVYSTCSTTGSLTAPIQTYDHTVGLVIIGGPLYRRMTGGVSFPSEYEGDGFFLDYYTGMLRRLKGSGSNWALAPMVPGQPSASDWGDGFDAVSDVIEMSDGSLAYCRQLVSGAPLSGEVRRITYAGPVAVGASLPVAFALAAPRPSPSRGSVTLAWSQPSREPVHLAVYDIGGRRIRMLADGSVFDGGSHQLVWDGRDDQGRVAGPGLYFVSLTAGHNARQGRITLIR